MPRLPASVLCALALTASAAHGELTVDARFPGGSAEVLALDAAAGAIHIAPASHPGRGWPCWWYFRVDGAVPGQKITLRVGASTQPFRPSALLPAMWALPGRAVVSVDDAEWQHTAPGTITATSGTYEIVAPAPRFWLAWGPPFLPSHSETLLTMVAAMVPDSERFTLATTRGGRAVPAIRLGTAQAPHAIWVQARQHAWEAGASWVGRGVIEWMASADADAVALRAQAEIFFVPIMDVDNVTVGAGGKEALPRDHNRDWAEQPVHPEVAAAQQRLASFAETGRLRVFIDLHNPGPGDRKPFFFGPLDYEEMTAARRAPYDRFLALARESIAGPLPLHPQFRFATYVKTEEERRRVSGTWVRHHGGENVVALTLETAWNTPASTTEGYRQVGRQLAQTIARYLASAPRLSD